MTVHASHSPWAKLLPPEVCVGLVLGGGAARGLAHIGVIRQLERAGIGIERIAGCSLGAIVGGCWAAERDIEGLRRGVKAYIAGDAFQKKALDLFRIPRHGGSRFSLMRLVKRGIYYGRILFSPSFFNEEEFRAAVCSVVPERRIEDLPTPFACNAAHLHTGRQKVFTAGPLREAVMASSAIPGIFPPMRLDGGTFIDGGWVDPLPVQTAHGLGADFVIAVDVSYRAGSEESYARGFSVVSRGVEIKTQRLIEISRSLADVVIRVEVDDVAWADFVRMDELIERGEQAAARSLDELEKKLRRMRWKKRIPFRDRLLKLLE
jgi:NTE family protein